MPGGQLLVIDVGAMVVRAGVYDMDGRCLGIRTRSVDARVRISSDALEEAHQAAPAAVHVRRVR